MPGPPVTIIDAGGIPVRQVESGAPVLTAVASGGTGITLSDRGFPFVVENLSLNSVARESNGNVTVNSLGGTWSPETTREPDGTVTVEMA